MPLPRDATIELTFNEGGGPAFPLSMNMADGSAEFYIGMTIRDWFASQVLAGGGMSGGAVERAQFAYEVADAMLTMRARSIKSRP